MPQRAEILSILKANIQELIEGISDRVITENDSLRDLTADSLEIVEIVSRTLKHLKITIPLSHLATANNLKELVDILEEESQVTSSIRAETVSRPVNPIRDKQSG